MGWGEAETRCISVINDFDMGQKPSTPVKCRVTGLERRRGTWQSCPCRPVEFNLILLMCWNFGGVQLDLCPRRHLQSGIW